MATSRLLLAVLLLAGTSVAGGGAGPQGSPNSGWLPVSANDDFSYFYNPKSVTRPGKGKAVAWIKAQAKPASRDRLRTKYLQYLKDRGVEIEGYKNFSYAMIQKEFDCAARKSRLVSVKDYDERGRMLSSTYVEDQNWGDVVAGSIEEELLKIFCKGPK